MLHYFTLNTSVEVICFLMAFFCLKSDDDKVWKSTILFIFITCVAEMTGIYEKRLNITDKSHIHSNAWVYNILIFFQTGYFSLMFLHLLNKQKSIKPVILIVLAFLVILHVYELYTSSIWRYDELTNTMMSVALVLYGFYFYYYLINDETYINLKESEGFWWVAGILFFYFGTTVYNLFYDSLSSLMVSTKQNLMYLKYLYNVFNIILYSCWSYSFICRRWLTTRTISEA